MFLTTVAALPVSKKLRQPYLELSGGAPGAPRQQVEIGEALKKLHCHYDNKLNLFYSRAGRGFLPQLRSSPSQAFVDLYNGNIELLQLILNMGKMEVLCANDVIQSLSSIPFCSILESEELLEQSFIASMNDTFNAMGLVDVIKFASDLHQLRGKQECLSVCGSRFNSVLCNAFVEMSLFIMDQIIESDLQTGKFYHAGICGYIANELRMILCLMTMRQS